MERTSPVSGTRPTGHRARLVWPVSPRGGSKYIIAGLQSAGVEILIVSASAERFVRGAAATLAVDPEHINGIRANQRDGLLTEELVYPVTAVEGKRRRLEEILQARERMEPGVSIYVIGGFGNSFGSDGPFLAWIAGHELPAGKPVVVMINGGPTPAPHAGMFTEIGQHAVIGMPPAREN